MDKLSWDGPKFSPNILQLSLLLCYIFLLSYRILLENVPFPFSHMAKLSQGETEPRTACMFLYQGKVEKEVVLSLDEV